MKTLLGLVVSLMFSFNSASWAGSNQPKVIADRTVLFEGDTPICTIDLRTNPEMAPAFVELPTERSVEQTTESLEHLNSLHTCGPEQMDEVWKMSQLAESGTRVAALPLVAIPIVVCAVAAGVGGYVTNKTLDLPTAGSVSAWTWVSSGAAAGGVIAGTGAFTLPAGYAAAYGGIIGAGCSMLGSIVGLGFYQHGR